MFAHLSLAKYLTFSRCLADALYRHGWRGERGEWQVLYITTIQQLSLKCPIASPRNGSPVAIWEPYNRNKGQLRRQLSWAMCQASLGFVWGCALSLSSGKEGAVYLSVGIYLDKLENILPPCLTGTGILLLP